MRTFLSCLFLLASSAQAAVTVDPDDMNISYTGRWDDSNISAPWAFWKGSSIIVNFEGTRIAADMSSSSTDYLRVIIDGDSAGSLKIAFYGDSNLAGYSLEHEQNQSGNHLRGTYYGFAGIVSRMFDAEYHNVSRSGATIRTLNNFYNRMDNGSRNPKWDFNDFIADVGDLSVGVRTVAWLRV